MEVFLWSVVVLPEEGRNRLPRRSHPVSLKACVSKANAPGSCYWVAEPHGRSLGHCGCAIKGDSETHTHTPQSFLFISLLGCEVDHFALCAPAMMVPTDHGLDPMQLRSRINSIRWLRMESVTVMGRHAHVCFHSSSTWAHGSFSFLLPWSSASRVGKDNACSSWRPQPAEEH